MNHIIFTFINRGISASFSYYQHLKGPVYAALNGKIKNAISQLQPGLVFLCPMTKESENLAIQMLDEIDRTRSGSLGLEELEFRLWRLLEAVDESFPPIVAGQVEDFVLEIRQLQKSNVSGPGGSEADENRGVDNIFNAITSAIGAAIR